MTEKVRISTDSTADIPELLCRQLHITVLPLSVIMENGKELRDGVDITAQEFYEILEKSPTIPTTSQVPVQLYEQLFEETFEGGYTDLIHVSINSKGSGTYQAGLLAKSLFYEKHPDADGKFNIYIIDSKTYSMGYGMAVCEGAMLLQNGGSASDIIDCISDWLTHSVVLFVPFNLKFVKKSGRVSAAAAFVGDAIGIKPIITFTDGDSQIVSKVRGDHKAIAAIVDQCKAEKRPNTNYVLVNGSNSDATEKLRELAEKELGMKPFTETYIGSVISINSGHNMVGIIYRT